MGALGLHYFFAQLVICLEGDRAESDGNISDDGFGVLSAHRSFVADALTVEEEDSPNDNSLMEWAEKEAKELGLMDSKK